MESKIKVGILSLGLIGSSILRGLADNPKYEIFAYSKSSYLKAKDFCKNYSDDINILSQAKIIFVCCDISKTLYYLDILDKILDKNTIVVDTCSIKNNLLDKKYNFNFILSHPMAGTEKSGFENGFSTLFQGSKWLYEKENDDLIDIIKNLGAIPFKIDMKDHDKMCAKISHLTTILSFLIFSNADDYSKKIASSGFRDMTRLSMTNPSLAINMLNLNFNNIENEFNNLISKFNDLKNMSDDEKINLFNEIKNKRAVMYDNNGKNIF